jgi:Polyketide cyclase / dehydrase and lipid transport
MRSKTTWQEAPMLRIEEAQVFPVSREVGFDYITDLRSWREYWPGFVGIRDESQAQWANPGNRVRLDLRLLGRTVTLNMDLEEFRRPAAVVYRTRQSGFPDAHHERHFDPVTDGFLYRIVVEYEPRKGLAGVFDRTLLQRAVRRTARQTIRNLSKALRPPAD